MKLHHEHLYHIYNQGNNQQPIFYSRENYLFFLKKMRKQIIPEARFLAYCLMPNHFHWLVYVRRQKVKSPDSCSLNSKIGTVLRSYTQAINKRYNRTGSLFRQKTKAKLLKNRNYALTCFHYIHQNPIRAALVNDVEKWPFSSFPDYAGLRKGSLIDKKFTYNYLDISLDSFVEETKSAINPQKIKNNY